MPMFKTTAANLGMEFRYLTIGAKCALLPKKLLHREAETRANCSKYISEIKKIIRISLGKDDVLVVGMHRQKIVGDIAKFNDLDIEKRESFLNSSQIRNKKKLLLDFYTSLANQLKVNKSKLLLVGDAPSLLRRPSQCLDIWSALGTKSRKCVTPLGLSKSHAAPLHSIFESIAKYNKNVFFWNPHDLLCSKDICTGYRGRVAVFIDQGHITEKSSMMLLDSFKKWNLKQLLL